MEASVKSYILRIYRFDRKSPDRLVGLAEEVGVREKKAFTNLEELWDILRSPEREAPVERTKNKGVIRKQSITLESEMKRKSSKIEKKRPGSSSGLQRENNHVNK